MSVTICTITHNRRPFIPMLIECVQYQTYGEVEWVIVDDGTDPIRDLVEHLPNVRYVLLPTKHTIGYKRNLSHTLATGDFLVYFDDDDWYPPTRVAHAVERLQGSVLECAGSTVVHLYVPNRPMVTLGPYHSNHATAATFAMKRSLLSQCHYNESATSGEECEFLKNYTVPMVQLDPMQTIVVFPHDHNTADKMPLFAFTNPYFHVSKLTLKDFGMPTEMQEFYTSLQFVLAAYEEGKPKRCSPDTIVTFNNQELNRQGVVQLLNYQHQYIAKLRALTSSS